MTNAEKYAPQIAQVLANTVEGMCIHFSKSIDYYGDFLCSTCPLDGVCTNVKKLEKFLRQEAKENDETAAP